MFIDIIYGSVHFATFTPRPPYLFVRAIYHGNGDVVRNVMLLAAGDTHAVGMGLQCSLTSVA